MINQNQQARATLRKRAWRGTLLLLSLAAAAQADISLDGTLGPAGPLTGPDYQIPAEVGQQIGSNLFHSFGVFNIHTGESATFTGPNSVQNILGRVTGGSSSTIDGLLRSQIPGAAVFLINPAGIVFGPNAQLDIPGSFHASTADLVRLGEEGRFMATQPQDSLLTVAPPAAFGFFGANPAPVTVQGSFLQVPEGETLSVIGGDIQLVEGVLRAPGGRINLASVASPGEVVPNAPDQAPALELDSFAALGKIAITHAVSSPRVEIDGRPIGNVDASGEGGGEVFIRGGQLVMENAWIFADTWGEREGKGIDIKVDRLALTNEARITSDTLEGAAGRGGAVAIEADSLELREGGQISAITFGLGDGGDVEVVAKSIVLSSREASEERGTGIFTTTLGRTARSGDAGAIRIQADHLEVREGAQVSATTFGSGKGGILRIQTDHLEVREGGQINAATFGPGAGGMVTVVAKSVVLSGEDASGDFPSGIFTSTLGITEGSGDIGDIWIQTDSLELREGAQISAATFGPGAGGDVDIVAKNISLSGGDASGIFPAGILSSTQGEAEGSGDAGVIRIQADRLEVSEGAQISASTWGTGAGGTVGVVAKSITLDSAVIFTSAQGSTEGSGDAGDIRIQTDSLEVREGAQINAVTHGPGAGGTVEVVAKSIALSGRDASGTTRSAIFTNTLGTTEGSGDAGAIWIQADSLEVREGAQIGAGTFGPGAGGTVAVVAKRIALSGTAASGKFPSGIFTSTEGETKGSEDAGDIQIQTDSLELREGAQIGADTFGPGQGGDIRVEAKEIELSNKGLISARSISENPEAGQSGKIEIHVNDTLRLLNGSRITVETTAAHAGDILLNRDVLHSGALVHLQDGSAITTSVAGGAGDGGNITLNSRFLVLGSASQIIADAQEGQAGNIDIQITGNGAFLQSPDSLLRASSELRIDAPDTDLSSSLAELPATFIDPAAILPTPCAARTGAEVIRLYSRRYEVLPESPEALRVRLPSTVAAANARAPTARTAQRASPAPLHDCTHDS